MSLVKLIIEGISYSQTQNGAYALILNEADGDRKLPIVIGAFEAQSIAITLEKDITPPRPLTHDLFKNFADRFDIKIKQIIIHKLVDGVFYSSIICERDGIEEIIDARTSDAIALALRFDAPIFTYKGILDKAGIIFKPKNEITEKEDADEEYQDDDDLDLDDISLLDDILDDNKEADHFKNEFKNQTLEQLYVLLDTSIQNEDYEKAAYIRDEINNREA
ncbi:bifunctional nuclease family protein [Flavobacterium agricola]|uniref:Bifunctional nuclease family protein n=1 Tax=Flavobacterium agricola TaxID=2870839 RepID=A0ABY6LYS9_9FLAO|nr:bifunctional nuclease family protein [Flavobacterium agricola]UYW01351.1 bifunctional nuclease family protein [Flavobacterium agricola]